MTEPPVLCFVVVRPKISLTQEVPFHFYKIFYLPPVELGALSYLFGANNKKRGCLTKAFSCG